MHAATHGRRRAADRKLGPLGGLVIGLVVSAVLWVVLGIALWAVL